MNLGLKNKNAFVGGGSAGLGLASAQQLALLGANVTITGRYEEALNDALKTLDTSLGQQHQCLALDVTEPVRMGKIISGFAASNSVHILVNNTGGPTPGRSIDKTPEEYTRAFESMLSAFMIQVQAFVPFMKEEGFGRIINITSTTTKEPLAILGLSNVVRAAVANLGKSLATDLGSFGITVNNVLPGSHETRRIQSLITNTAVKTGKSEEEIRQGMVDLIPAGRFGTPEEFGSAVAFLCSPAASYINGINMPVDGGRLSGL